MCALVKNSYDITIKEGELDCSYRPAFVNLCRYIVTVAGYDAVNIGCGVIELGKKQHSWVLSRLSVEWSRVPQAEEQISIQTWISDVNRLMSTRNFRVYDKNKEQIGEAVTSWATIDINTRKALDLRVESNYMSLVIDDKSNIEPERKLPRLSEGEVYEHTVRYSDMDFNNHTNAMRYIDMMCDMLPIEKLRESFIRRFDIHFIQESVYGDVLSVRKQTCDDKYLFEITNSEQASICRACIRF